MTFQVTISIEGEAGAAAEPEAEKKEKPIWMVESTIEGASTENIPVSGTIIVSAFNSQIAIFCNESMCTCTGHYHVVFFTRSFS